MTDILAQLDAAFERHAARLEAINGDYTRRNEAILARIDMELDALARLKEELSK